MMDILTREETPQDRPKILHLKKKYLAIGGIALFLGVLGLTSYYSMYLSARVAPGLRFSILGPTSLAAGKDATITWDTTPANVARFPYEKIEYCSRKPLKKCLTLAVSVPNNGRAVVKVPENIPVGTGYIQLTARDFRGRIKSMFKMKSGLVSVTARSGDNNGGGGSSSGGGSGSSENREDNGNQPVPPAPYAPYAPYSGNNANSQKETMLTCAYSDQDGAWNFHNNILVAPGKSREIGVVLSNSTTGTPLSGKTVRFGAPDRGSLSTYTVTTSSSGVAKVTYTAPNNNEASKSAVFTATFPADGDENKDLKHSSCTINIDTTAWVSLACPQPYVDVNGDGSVTSADSALVTDYINGNRTPIAKTGASWQNKNNPADVNASGSVTPSDVLIVINQVNKASGPIQSVNCPVPPPSPYAGS